MTSPLRLGLAGLGTVGSATLSLLREHAETLTLRAGRPLVVTAVSARGRVKARAVSVEGLAWEDNPLDLPKRPDVDVVVELIGGASGVAPALAEATFAAGKDLVTANKALLAAKGAELAHRAEDAGRRLMFEAAVGGGIPLIKTLRESLAGNHVRSVQGILNGTCNYILTRMEAENLSFGVALEGAQAKGYAEADPTADIEGHDTAHKLSLLAALAFGTAPNLADVTIEGIQRVTPVDFLYAARLGYRIKLLGVAHLTDEGLEQRVGPCLVPLESPLARVDDVLNAAQIEGDAVGALTLIGRGAGGRPTASAVLADLVDLARGTTVLPFGVRVRDLRSLPSSPPDKRVGEWYMRLHVKDQPGVVAEVSAILRDEAISIESLLQHGRSETREVPVIITTHAVDEASLRRASRRIGQLSVVREEPFCLKIERPEDGA